MPHVEVPDPNQKPVYPEPPGGRRHRVEDLPKGALRWSCEWPETPILGDVVTNEACTYCRMAEAAHLYQHPKALTQAYGQIADALDVPDGTVVPMEKAFRVLADPDVNPADVVAERMLDERTAR